MGWSCKNPDTRTFALKWQPEEACFDAKRDEDFAPFFWIKGVPRLVRCRRRPFKDCFMSVVFIPVSGRFVTSLAVAAATSIRLTAEASADGIALQDGRAIAV
jgi:hypothetical protein